MNKTAYAIAALIIAAAIIPARAQPALDDPDTQRILQNYHEEQVYQQRVLDRANNYNPPGDAFYPSANQILQNATDSSGALRIAR